MSKPIELIYSRQASDFVEGKAYSNPRFFSTPREGVSKVFIVGDYPNIRKAYEARGVPVVQLGDAPAAAPLSTAKPPASLTPGLADGERAKVEIPTDWRGLSWPKLRGLGSQFSNEPVLNKAGATAAIEAEIARRAARPGDNPSTQGTSEAETDEQNGKSPTDAEG